MKILVMNPFRLRNRLHLALAVADDETHSFIAFTRPELKFGLVEESPLKRTES